MGCDIHIGIERLNHNNKWIDISAYKVNPYFGEDEYETNQFNRIDPYKGRNYELFSALCGVRSRGHKVTPISEPRGIPSDCSQFIKEDFERWGCDAHSASHSTLKEIIDYGEQHKTVTRTGMISPEQFNALKIKNEKPESWCGWTSNRSWVEAEWEDDLKCIQWFLEEVKQYLKGILWRYEVENLFENPEKVRFIYWFDN